MERFGNVVISAVLEAGDDILVLPERGKHHNRDLRTGADSAAQQQSVHGWHENVEYHEIDGVRTQDGERGGAIVRAERGETLRLQGEE
jgi:hypothetical protein